MASYLDRIRKDGQSANPFFCLMGIEVAGIDDGRALLRMQVREDMLNGVGWLQGGIFTALADEAIALALYTQLSPGEGIATISESTSYIRGVREGALIAEGRVLKKGRRVAFTEADVFLADGKKTPVSRTSAAFAITAELERK